jgi:hypothetical protein
MASLVWHDPPERCRAAFIAAYTALYTHGYSPVTCPCCRAGVLRLYYHTHDQAQRGAGSQRRGGSWLWCPTCGAYDHASALIPAWWPATIQVPLQHLLHSPEGLDAYWAEILATLGGETEPSNGHSPNMT